MRVKALTLDDLLRHIARELRVQWPQWSSNGPCIVISSHGPGEMRVCVRKKPQQVKQ